MALPPDSKLPICSLTYGMLGVNGMLPQQRDITRPRAGFWMIRMRKGAPLVPARIVYEITPDPWFPDNPMDRSGEWKAYIGDMEVPLDEVWLRRGIEISQLEYDFQMERRRWAADAMPEHPLANPEQPVDWMQFRLPF